MAGVVEPIFVFEFPFSCSVLRRGVASVVFVSELVVELLAFGALFFFFVASRSSSSFRAFSAAALSIIVCRSGSSIDNDALIRLKKAPRPNPRTPEMAALPTQDSIVLTMYP